MKFLYILIASLLLMCSGCSTTRYRVGPTPLVVASCPDLTELEGTTFGDVVRKLAQVAGQYNECKAAALAGE